MAYDRNASARSKGYRNYYDYRKSQAQSRGYRNPNHLTNVNKAVSQLPARERNAVTENVMWQTQVPEHLQDSGRLQRAFEVGFLGPLGSKSDHRTGHKMSLIEKSERQYFLDAVEDFDWDMWQEYVEEEGNSPGGE